MKATHWHLRAEEPPESVRAGIAGVQPVYVASRYPGHDDAAPDNNVGSRHTDQTMALAGKIGR